MRDRLVCVGGPRDGETLEVPKGERRWGVPMPPPEIQGAYVEFDGGPPMISVFTYQRMMMWMGRDAIFEVLTPLDQTAAETLRLLLVGYTPCR